MFDLLGGKKEGKSDLRWVHVTLKPQRCAPRWWNITQTRWILTIEDNYARHSYFHQCPSSPTPPPHRLSRALCFFSSKNKPTRLCGCWGDSLAQREQRAASCLQYVTPPSLLLFLPPSSIYNFPPSYICLAQLSGELFVTKKAFTLDFCLLLIIFDRTTQEQNVFVFPAWHFDEYK